SQGGHGRRGRRALQGRARRAHSPTQEARHRRRAKTHRSSGGMTMFARQIANHGREIVYRTGGRTHGPITRLVSPSDLGELIKPFVFLDLAAFDGRLAPRPMDYGWHPHSGIATVTVMLEGAVRFAETTGKDGVLPPGSVEWM